LTTSRATIMVFLLTLASSALGFGREAFIAYSFGATGMSDAYYIAAIVPEMVASWIGYTLTNSIIPVLQQERTVSEESTRKLISNIFWGAACALFLLTMAVFALKQQVITILAPGLSLAVSHESKHLLAIMVVAIMFSGLSGVLWGINNAYENFSYPALIGIVYNLLLLGFAVILKPWFGIEALAYGFLFGTAGRFIIQLIPLLMEHRLILPILNCHPRLGTVCRLMPPVFISAGLGSLNLIVDRILASGLPAGRISDLNYVSKVGLLPASIVGLSIATTLYTRFVRHSNNGDLMTLQRVIKVGVGIAVLIGLIIGSEFIINSRLIISILFGHGQFTLNDVRVASGPLKVYGWFEVFYLLQPIMIRFFYARQENRFVMCVSLASVGVNIALSLALVHSLNIIGLVMANGLSQLTSVVILTVAITRRLHWSLKAYLLQILRVALPPGIAFLFGIGIVSCIWRLGIHTGIFVEILQAGGTTILGITFLLLCLCIDRNNVVSSLFLSRLQRIRS
jgi:putative peptidoglycan lipid II flippase